MDLLERQELVRLLVKEFGVDVNRILPGIPETPTTLLALCNASSSDMHRCLLNLGADITKNQWQWRHHDPLRYETLRPQVENPRTGESIS